MATQVSRVGFGFWIWTIIGVMLIFLYAGMHYFSTGMREMNACEAQLESMYLALEFYEMDNGLLPDLAYFPSRPKEGANSLVQVLKPYGLQPESCVCPAAGALLAEQGLTYIWNADMSGKRLGARNNPTWLLIEIQALSARIKRPHFNAVHVLYTDGHIRKLKEIPHEILKDGQGLERF